MVGITAEDTISQADVRTLKPKQVFMTNHKDAVCTASFSIVNA